MFGYTQYTYHLIWFNEQHVECQGEYSHQQQSEKCNLQERFNDIYEHQNIDPHHKPFLKWYEYNPAQEYSNNSDLPLPVINTKAWSCKHECEYCGAQVQRDLQPVDPILQVLHWMAAQLYHLYCKLQECSCYGEGSTNEEKLTLINGQI